MPGFQLSRTAAVGCVGFAVLYHFTKIYGAKQKATNFQYIIGIAPAQRPRQAKWTSQPIRPAENCSERANSRLRRATNIVTVDIILMVISLRNLKINIFLRKSLSKVVEVLTSTI
jgi:hypothetical protein